MPKHFKIFLFATLAFLINVRTIDAASCSPSDSKWNALDIKPYSTGLGANVKLIYEITKIKMNGDVMEVHGWAGASSLDSILGDNAQVELYFFPVGEQSDTSKHVKLDISYASPGGTDPKYYDLTYWDCFKFKDSSGNVHCAGDAGSGPNANGYGTPILKGGFKGTLDLKEAFESGQLEQGKEYRLQIKLTGPRPFDQPATVFTELVEQSVKDYTGYTSDTDNKEVQLTITGFGEKATVINSKGQPNGLSGLGCDRPFASGLYYNQGSSFEVGSSLIRACRGPNCNGKDSGDGSVYLYPLYAQNVNGKIMPAASGGTVTYAPASWLNFDGSITISTKLIEEEEPDAPEECEGEEIYHFYYFFLAGVDNATSGWMYNSAQGANFGDADIFKKLGIEKNTDIIKGGGNLRITKKNLDWYYEKTKAANASADRYVQEGNNYYIAYDSWCSINGSATDCFEAATGCKLVDGVPSSDCKANKMDGNFNPTTQKSYAVDVDSPPTGGKPITIDRQDDSSGLGFRFSLKRYFKATPGGRPSMMNPTVKVAKDQQHPAVYELIWCKGKEEEADCEDTVNQATCYDSDIGTEFVFNENDDKTVCTLKHDTASGFVAIEEEETNAYCTMACKEDLHGTLPTTKFTAAGQYFVLDVQNGEPITIDAKRTCVTSEIKYDQFNQDITKIEQELKDLYNEYQDYLYLYENTVLKIGTPSNPIFDHTDNYSRECGPIQVPDTSPGALPGATVPQMVRIEGTVTNKKWKVDSQTGPNGKVTLPAEEQYESGPNASTVQCGPAPTFTPPTFTDHPNTLQKYKDEYKQKVIQAKNKYNEKLNTYRDTINSYNRCFNWTEKTKDTKIVAGGGDIKPANQITNVTGDNTDKYVYGFNPDVSFWYEDRDGEVFPVEYPFDKPSSVDPDEEKKTWEKGATIDDKYEEGGGSTFHPEPHKIVNCAGDSSTSCTSTYDSEFFDNSYIRRDEKLDFEYHLPQVVTTIPDGKAFGPGNMSSKDPDKPEIYLEPEAVPVNINTKADKYDYYVKITNIVDELRASKKGNNPDDDFQERFNGEGKKRTKEGALADKGDEYVCYYDVINDIYIPDDGPNKKFNFFYRVVDTYEINPLQRQLGYNWTGLRADEVKRLIQEDALSYSTLTNADGTDPKREKFVYTLTPATMQSIREYNASLTRAGAGAGGYSDWDLKCYDYEGQPNGGSGTTQGYHCYSNFLNCLTGSGENCTNVVGGYHDNCNGDECYDKADLDENRRIFVNKQIEIDQLEGKTQ